jgi:hypothetical protein
VRLLLRLIGIRTFESPEAIRITLPRWVVKVMPDVLEKTREKVRRDHADAFDVRIVKRSIIARFR